MLLWRHLGNLASSTTCAADSSDSVINNSVTLLDKLCYNKISNLAEQLLLHNIGQYDWPTKVLVRV